MKRTILILIDGLRPDALLGCGHGFTETLLARSVHDLSARTVMPSVTLPCHMSLFHSVTPGRHGILTTTYVPQVRPVRGLCEVLRAAGKVCSFYYDWEELRDLSRPDALASAVFVSGHVHGYEEANRRITAACISALAAGGPDFSFLSLGWTDAAGHGFGWMGEEYLGFGASAASWLGGKRFTLLPDAEGYIRAIDSGGELLSELEEVSLYEQASEYVMLRMRTARGMDPKEYSGRYQNSFEPLEKLLEGYVRLGLAQRVGERWRFTPRGFLLSNRLIGELLDAQAEQKYPMGIPWRKEDYYDTLF